MKEPCNSYDDLWFDFNLIKYLPIYKNHHPDFSSYHIVREYFILLDDLKKRGIDKEWQIAHIDSLMLLHFFKHGALPRNSIGRLSKSGHLSTYRSAASGESSEQEYVRMLPKGLETVKKSFEDHRVSLQIFPLLSDLSQGHEDEILKMDFIFCEHHDASLKVVRNIFDRDYTQIRAFNV